MNKEYIIFYLDQRLADARKDLSLDEIANLIKENFNKKEIEDLIKELTKGSER